MPETTENAAAPEADANAKAPDAEASPAPAQAEAAPPPKEMKSIVLTGFGGVKMLKVQQKPEATPGDGDVLIRVKAW